jgi:nicotinate-nucleotide adenylyltransferase
LIRKVGILGGTFDPVHNGHLALAKTAGEICSLDEILLLPAALPPHKQCIDISEFSQRVAMLDIAVEELVGITVSTIEELLPVPSFTIDTLQYLKLHSPTPVQFYFICGADTFLDILSWKSFEEIIEECNFIVFSRAGMSNKKLKCFIKKLGYTKKSANSWQHPQTHKQIYHANRSPHDVSSSEVRKRLRKGKSVALLIPEKVISYIRTHSLYV